MKFYRITQGAVIGGVCMGISRELKIDPLIVRLAALILFFISAGLVGFIYLLLWTVLPAEDSNSTIKEELMEKLDSIEILKGRIQNPLLIGILLIVAGVVLFLNYILPVDLILSVLIPLALVGFGAYIIFKNKK